MIYIFNMCIHTGIYVCIYAYEKIFIYSNMDIRIYIYVYKYTNIDIFINVCIR